MNTIKLNDVEFQVESYNRSTSFTVDSRESTASCVVLINDTSTLNELAETTITTIQIYVSGALIYELENISAHITAINEYLTEGHIGVSVDLRFDF